MKWIFIISRLTRKNVFLKSEAVSEKFRNETLLNNIVYSVMIMHFPLLYRSMYASIENSSKLINALTAEIEVKQFVY